MRADAADAHAAQPMAPAGMGPGLSAASLPWPGRQLPLAPRMPTNHRIRHGIRRGEIGFEIEQRRAVEAVEADYRKHAVLALDEPNHAHRNRIGPYRRAQRKAAPRLPVMPRHLEHEVAPRAVHPVEHEQMAA